MKRFLSFLAAALLGPMWRMPAWAQLTTLTVGGGAAVVVIGILTPPSITPQASLAFTQSQPYDQINNGIRTNGTGAAGAEEPPANADSFFFYVEGQSNPNLINSGYEYALGVSGAGTFLLLNGGNQAASFETQSNKSSAFWLGLSPTTLGASPSSAAGTNYSKGGYYPWTATGGNCAREPSGVWTPGSPTAGGPGTAAKLSDPGFLCEATPTITVASGDGNLGEQNTDAGGVGTTCSVVNGLMTVTATVANAHGITPAQTFTLAGFTPTGYNTTYTALPGTTGETLVGTPATTTTSCPLGVSAEGRAFTGSGGTVALTSISATNPFGTNQNTGIQTKAGEHFCGVIGEYGADSPTPGFQFAAFSNRDGTTLPGSPAVVPWPNQGVVQFTGYVTTGAQSPSSPALTVTAMTSFSISAATYSSSTGYVTFTTGSATGMIPGSEFTVSGVTSSGAGSFNATYIVVLGTTPTGTTVVGNPLSGPLGYPQSSGLTSGSSYTSGGSMVGVITPNMQIFGGTGASQVLPFGTYGGTGTGGTGTYGLNNNQSTFTFTGSASNGSTTIAVSGLAASPPQNLAIGEAISGTNIASGTTITGYQSGATGSSGNYTLSAATTGAVSGTVTAAGLIGSSGTPVAMFAWTAFFYTGAATPSETTTIPVLTARTQSSVGDFFNTIGAYNTLQPPQFAGWGGSLANAADFYGVFPNTATTPSTTALNSLCEKTTDFQTFASANSFTIHSLYRLNDPGMWGDSGNAQITGYLSGATGTSGGTATLNVVSTLTGSLALPTSTQTAYLAGMGINPAGPPSFTLTASSSSTYTVTFPSGYTSVNVGSSGSPVMLSVGAYKPALPNVNNGFNGYITSTGGGMGTLTVTSIASANRATFTGSTSIPTATATATIAANSNVLDITAGTTPTGAAVIGATVTGSGIPGGTYIQQGSLTGEGTGNTGNYSLNWTNTGSALTGVAITLTYPNPIWAPTNLATSSPAGTIATGMLVTDNGGSIGNQPLRITGGSGSTWTINPNYYGPISGDTAMVGVSTFLMPGQYLNSNTLLTSPVKIVGYGTGANAPGICPSGVNGGIGEYGCGVYQIYNPGGLTIGSSGSPAAFNAGGASDGAAVAPGPALEITDQGPGIEYPVTNYTTSTGTLWLSGTYNTGSLGGTPSAIQAEVSYTAGGPPISGCSACAWTTLTNGVISGGSWSGQALNIPAGGPYYVSVRAANGTAYATLPSPIKVGFVFDIWGVGQSQAVVISNSGGWFYSTTPYLWGTTSYVPTSLSAAYDTGPAIQGDLFPTQVQQLAGDQFTITGAGTEPLLEGEQQMDAGLAAAFGYPVTVANWTRDGNFFGLFSQGQLPQTQTIGLGTGSVTTFCSSTTFCPGTGASLVGQGGTLDYNIAAMTGSQFTGSISGATLTVGALLQGALEPGEVLSGPGITGSPTLVNCTSGCGGLNAGPSNTGAQWTISSPQTVSSGTVMRADPVGGAPAPWYNPQDFAPVDISYFGQQLIEAGTFKISVNGTVVCTDSNTAVYNVMGGNCTGAGISSSFVNYLTGDYDIVFSTAPANNAVITASWTEIMSPDDPTYLNVFHNLDYTGNGTATTGFLSQTMNKTPGGSSGHIFAACLDGQGIYEQGYGIGAGGLTQELDWFYGVQLPRLMPWESPTTPLINTNDWRGDGPDYLLGTNSHDVALNALCDQWANDSTLASSFPGTIGSAGGSSGDWTATLTLSGAATGPMWEGETIGCNPFSTGCAVTPGTYILSLASGTWGAGGSTYNLRNDTTIAISNVASSTTMMNAALYTAGPAIYAGANNDNAVACCSGGLNGSDGYSPHPAQGPEGAGRIGRRWGADIYGAISGAASSPTLDRNVSDVAACDSSATVLPCFDIGTTYAASASATWSGAVATITGGLAAHARPFVVGQEITCSGCNSGLVITAMSVPPTQSTASGAGEVGQTFTITASGAIGGSGSGTIVGRCEGAAGTGSNCIDVAFTINDTGTFGTTAALATCGENTLNGSAPWWNQPMGICSNTGIGALVHNFRIGTVQAMNGGQAVNQNASTGSVYDDGVEPYGGSFNQNAAFTCNIVAAKVVQCVKGAAYSSGVFTSVGQWNSTGAGGTYVSYGDTPLGTARGGGALIGNMGGQPFGFTAGSGYTPGKYTITASNCATSTGTFVLPKVDVTVGSGGSIIDVYGSTYATTSASSAGYAIGNGCTFNLGSSITASITSSVLSVTALTGGLASGQVLSGAGITGSPTLNACTTGCSGPVQGTVSQTWSLTGYSSGNISSESMTTLVSGIGSGSGGAISTPNVWPTQTDGGWGISVFNNSANLYGDELYDNSGLPGNPLNAFFTNGLGGYYEPGLQVRPFGEFIGAQVSG
jgi:hypothetical protein